MNKKPSPFRLADSYLVSERSQPFFFFLSGAAGSNNMKERPYRRSRGGRLWEMIGRQIAALGMEIVVRYGKEGKAEGLDSKVMVAAPKTGNLAF